MNIKKIRQQKLDDIICKRGKEYGNHIDMLNYIQILKEMIIVEWDIIKQFEKEDINMDVWEEKHQIGESIKNFYKTMIALKMARSMFAKDHLEDCMIDAVNYEKLMKSAYQQLGFKYIIKYKNKEVFNPLIITKGLESAYLNGIDWLVDKKKVVSLSKANKKW